MIWQAVRQAMHRIRGMKSTYHLVAAPDKDSDGAGVGALLDDEHLLSCCAKGHLPDDAGFAELLGLKILEPGNNAAVGRNRNQLDLRAADPPYGGEVVLEKEMVGLVVETPLADGQVRAGILYLLDHLDELLALVRLQLLELLDAADLELVLGLGLGGLKGARQDGDLGVAHLGGHLGVREVLVDDDALDEDGVLKGAADLAVNLDQLKVNILALKIGD